MVDGESSNEQEKLSPAEPEQEHRFSELRHYVPTDILDVSFPLSVRGYERRAVDGHDESGDEVAETTTAKPDT